MFSIDRAKLSLCALATAFLPAGMAFAQPAATHTVTTFSDTDTSGASVGVGPVGTDLFFSRVIEAIDDVTPVGYRYFALQDLGGSGAGVQGATSNTVISGLDTSKDYLFLFLPASIAEDDAVTTISVIYNNVFNPPTYTSTYTSTGTTTTGTFPAYIISNVSLVRLFIVSSNTDASSDFGIQTGVVTGLVEITTDPAYHNDCDINDDGSVDELDVDMLNAAIESGAFATVTNADAIAMFDVNNDGDVDVDDIDELVYICLATDYGDTDLDGDIDHTDLGNAFANYTGPVGGAGGKTWADGDTDRDGDVDDADISTIFANFTGPL